MKLLIFLLIFIAITVPAAGENLTRVVTKNGFTNLTFVHNNKKFSLSILTGPFSPSAVDSNGWRWGAEGKQPKIIIENFTISCDGKQLFVPITAWLGLGNPRTIQVSFKNNKLQVTIIGGDAATSYKATIGFGNSSVKYRKVESAEFPEESYEETFYHYPEM